jgi:hypothetical protein
VHGRGDQCQVDRSFGELPNEVAGPTLIDDQLDAGITLPEHSKGIREESGAQARGGAQPQPTPPQLRQLVDL